MIIPFLKDKDKNDIKKYTLEELENLYNNLNQKYSQINTFKNIPNVAELLKNNKIYTNQFKKLYYQIQKSSENEMIKKIKLNNELSIYLHYFYCYCYYEKLI